MNHKEDRLGVILSEGPMAYNQLPFCKVSQNSIYSHNINRIRQKTLHREGVQIYIIYEKILTLTKGAVVSPPHTHTYCIIYLCD